MGVSPTTFSVNQPAAMRSPRMSKTQISRQGGMVECRLTDGKPLVSLPASDAEEEGILILEAGTPEDAESFEESSLIFASKLNKPEARSPLQEAAEDIRERTQHYLHQFTGKFDPETMQQLAHIQREKGKGGDQLAMVYGEKSPVIKSLNQKRQDLLDEQLDAEPKQRESIRRELVAMGQAIQQLLQLNGYDKDGNKLHRSAHGDTFLKRGAEKMKAEVPQSAD